jgi:DNA repair exonuclease SbcCD ATPase subunit
LNLARWVCRQEAQAAHASQHQEHLTALERLRAEHDAELEQLAEQMMQLEARLDEATASSEAHAATAANLQERLEQQEDQAKAAAAQARAIATRRLWQALCCVCTTTNNDRSIGDE